MKSTLDVDLEELMRDAAMLRKAADLYQSEVDKRLYKITGGDKPKKENVHKLLPPSVSDHAVVRYLERVRDVDVFKLRQHILAGKLDAINAGACGIVSGGFRYIVKDGVIVTVMDKDM